MEVFFSLQGTSISHLGKKETHRLKTCLDFLGDMLVPQEAIYQDHEQMGDSSVIVSWVVTIVNPCKLVEKSPK